MYDMKIRISVTLIIASLCVCAAACAGPSDYHILKKIPLGGEGRWDALAVDSSAGRLYISRGTHVMVLNLATNKLAGDIPDTPGVHGIAVAPELNRGFISNGKSDTVMIFDLKTLKVLG